MRARGRCEFIGDLAGVLPMDVISELLGVPSPDRAELRAQADLLVHREEGVFDVPPAAGGRVRQDLAVLRRARRGAPARAEGRPDQRAARRRDRRRSGSTTMEVQSFCNLMIVAGNETTTKLLANALYWLWRNPGPAQAPRRRPGADPALGRGDAALRQLDARRSRGSRTGAVELHGVEIPAAKRVVLLVGSANRDERAFPNADALRPAARHQRDAVVRPGRALLSRRGARAARGARRARGVLAALPRLRGRAARASRASTR